MSKIKIITCTHIDSPLVRTEAPYLPVHAGKALDPDVDYGFQGDDEGDNISLKNREYCELTALYWGWKNLKDVKYAGLAHGHRYLDLDIDESNADLLMKGVDMYVAERKLVPSLIGESLAVLTSSEDCTIFIDTLLKLHPEYRQTVLEYFYKNRMLYRCNIFIARKELYDKYCETFFPVYFEAEKRMRRHPFSRQNRAIAYFGEYSLGLFIMHENLKVKTRFCIEDGNALNTTKQKLEHMKWRAVSRIKHAIYKRIGPKCTDIPVFWSCVAALQREGIDIDFYLK